MELKLLRIYSFNYIAYRVSSLHTAEDLTSLVFEKTLAKLATYSQEKADWNATKLEACILGAF